MATKMRLLLAEICLMLISMFMFDTAQAKIHATNQLSNQVLQNGNCNTTLSSPLIKPAYRAWPYTLEWEELDAEFRASIYDDYDYEQYPANSITIVNCIIWDLDANVLIYNASYDAETGGNQSYRFPDMGENSSLNFEIILSKPGSHECLATLVHINLTDLPNHTCEEAVRLSTQRYSSNKHLGEYAAFSCITPQSMTPKLNAGEHTTHEWLKDCSSLPAYIRSHHNKALHITNITYEHPGIYTCAVTHNKQTWYAVHYNLCVGPRKTFHRHAIKCSMETVYAEVGDKAIATCIGYLSNWHSNRLGLHINWKKKPIHNSNLTRCENPTISQKKESFSRNNPNVKCAYEMDRLPCFERTPSEEERKVKPQTIKMKLEIRNVKDSDFGEYEVTLKSITGPPIKATVAIKRSEERGLVTLAVGIGISFGILFILMIFAIVSYTTYKKRKNSTPRQVKRSKSADDTTTITESI